MADPDALSRRRAGSAAALVIAAVLAVGAFAAGRTASPSPERATTGTASTPATLAAGPVDVGFAQDMLDHHQQALQMGMLAAGKASTAPVRALALSMVSTQQHESGRLRQFLHDRGQGDGEPGREVMGWMGHPMPFAQMPGLLPPDELVALTNAEGRDFDRRFVELMRRHHRGATEMADYAAEHGEDSFTRSIAGQIRIFQLRELTDLESLLPGLTS